MKITIIECHENAYPIYDSLVQELQASASNINLKKLDCPLAEKTHVFVKKAILAESDAVIYCLDSRVIDQEGLSHLRNLVEQIELETGKMCLECSINYKQDKEEYLKDALVELNTIVKIILDSEGYEIPKEIIETKQDDNNFIDVDKGKSLF